MWGEKKATGSRYESIWHRVGGATGVTSVAQMRQTRKMYHFYHWQRCDTKSISKLGKTNTPITNMQGSEWRGGGKINTRRGTRCPTIPYTPVPFASGCRCCVIGALWSCCHGDVGQSADVQAQRGFDAGSRVQTVNSS